MCAFAMHGIDLKVSRIKARLKQYEVAARLGMPQTILSEIEAGKREISPEVFVRIEKIIAELSQVRQGGKRIPYLKAK